MTMPEHTTPAWPPYVVRTHSVSSHEETTIHTDEVARSYGFKGALIAGRAVYSQLLHPLLERFGEAMLTRGRVEIRFAKPAYEGDIITVVAAPVPGGDARAVTARATNQEGTELARLEASLPEPFPQPHGAAQAERTPFAGTRLVGRWENLVAGTPWPAYRWQSSRQEQLDWCEQLGERLPLFRAGEAPPLHPGLIPTAVTEMLHAQVITQGWAHASSVYVSHRLIRAGEALELRPTPIERFERKGRQFVVLHVGLLAGGAVAAEEFRTAIVNLGRQP
ncbi:MAG: MaoC family dehydratase [Candidatus Lambdaproteobacteria bacterium]|nr:MaoC family dehydratase [Candidatus Lambdaproteobacteria bacterium]